MHITLRPLVESDANTSWKWRNDPEVFRNTGKRYFKPVTLQNELDWIRTVLSRPDEYRFAIVADDIYIGNIYLTGITTTSGEISIFIGEKSYWNKGIGTLANALLLKYAFSTLTLDRVKSIVRIENIASQRAHEKVYFEKISSDKEFIYYEITRDTFLSKKTSIICKL